MTHPSHGNVAVVYFDHGGHERGYWKFSTGHRLRVTGMEFRDSNRPYPILYIETGPVTEAPDIRRQYYLLSDSGPSLVRLEKESGEALPLPARHNIGPTLNDLTLSQWRGLLFADDFPSQLRALATTPSGALDWRRDVSIRTRLQELGESSDAWVADAARMYVEYVPPTY